jgi:hypothetical protein
MKYLKSLNELQALAEKLDSAVNKLCEVFPNAFESRLVEVSEEILCTLIEKELGTDLVDLFLDWRFVHEYGAKEPMVFYFGEDNEIKKEASDNSELAEILETLGI